MANWNVLQMDCYPDYEGNSDVVFTVHWDCVDTQGEYSGRVYGAQGLTLDPEAAFTPYSSLTEAQVIGWVKAALGEEAVEAAEANVAQQIADQANPPVVQPALPW